MRMVWFLCFGWMIVWGYNAEEIIKKVDHNLQSKSSHSHVTMIVETSRAVRTMKLESWNQGNEKSFIRIHYPPMENGITFLKVGNAMWQYVPRIEKTIRIPGSMMMQSWMGSDFTNDDMAKESSIVDDYIPSILSEETNKVTLNLLPKPEAAVVWGKIVLEVQKPFYYPLQAQYYDEKGKLIRTLEYTDVKKISERYFPSMMVLRPVAKPSNKTTVRFDEIDFDAPIEAERFTKNALLRYSR